jgi:hypothetical protein
MTGTWTRQAALGRHLAVFFVVAAGMAGSATPAYAVVKIFEGFGDADLDNNNIPLEPNDADVSGAGDGTVTRVRQCCIRWTRW